jgi:arylsulfatase A-like enzyme
MMWSRTRSSHALALTALAATVGTAVLAGAPRERTAARAEPVRPNILVIITDDQRKDGSMDVMPKTLHLFREGGTEFTNFYVTTPLCCPSRGSFWSGRYAHNHGVLTNGDPQAEAAYDQTTAIQYALRSAGYATALVGKYWNTWPLSTPPPNYDRWAMMTGSYRDASWNIDGTIQRVPGYTTMLAETFAAGFLRDFEREDDRPWFLYVAPQAPHSPYTAEPRYASTAVPPWTGNPAVFEADRSDKPPAVRGWNATFDDALALRAKQLRTLMSVDDMVATLFSDLDRLGETQDTLAVFTSDNGMLWGEHGLTGKRFPYTASVQVPMFIRWPGHIAEGAIDDRLTANIDLAPTLLEAAGLSPDHVVDGASLLGTGSRGRLLLEYFKSPDAALTNWASILTPTYQYVEWYRTTTSKPFFREYYDLVNDPWQLTNLLADGNPTNDPDVARLHAQLTSDRRCAGDACPMPTG